MVHDAAQHLITLHNERYSAETDVVPALDGGVSDILQPEFYYAKDGRVILHSSFRNGYAVRPEFALFAALLHLQEKSPKNA